MYSRSRLIAQRTALVIGLALALLVATVQLSPRANAAGPPYSGPQTELVTGPAYFGPAPNPIPYCENPTYFDPFPENGTVDAAGVIVNQPIGSIDVNTPASPNASVTTDNITMDFTLTAEGAPGTQYPGFFPGVGPDGVTVLGGASDQPKGVEMAGGDVATVTLSEPLFYSQWVFTDVDRVNEGFTVTPAWTGAPGAVIVMGGDADFVFAGTSTTAAVFDEALDGIAPNPAPPNEQSGSINGRVQVDFIGAVTGIEMARAAGNGQSGFAVGGGCSPVGVAKRLASGPTWNSANGVYEAQYEIVVRNNLPSAAVLQQDTAAALAAAASGTSAGTVTGITLNNVTLTDILGNAAFSNVNVTNLVNVGNSVAVNFPGFNGVSDTNLLQPNQGIDAGVEETFVLTVEYTPDPDGPLGPTCASTLDLENSAVVRGNADGVDVEDMSDNGTNPDPGVDNGEGGVDDPTPVPFECAPAGLEIVKTVVPGPGGTCPSFADGVVGDGPALMVTEGDTVTYCIAVNNPGVVNATNVVVTDPMAPAGFDGTIGTLAGGGEDSVSFDLVVDDMTPTLNTATATGTGPQGDLGPVTDTAIIDVMPPAAAGLAIVKTVVPGPGGTCPSFADGVVGDGPALMVTEGDTVTYCIAVSNPGEGTATNVVVTDPMAPAGFDGTIGTLAGGAEASVSFDLVVDDTTPTLNTATATGTGPQGDIPPVDDTAIIDVSPPPVPSIAISKTIVPEGVSCDDAVEGTDELVVGELGDPVTWCIVVTNDGETPLTNILIDDPLAGIEDLDVLATFGGGAAALPVGQSIRFSVPGTVLDGGAVNTILVEATPSDPDGNPLPDLPIVRDDNDAAVDEVGIALSKTVVAGPTGDCAAAVNEITVLPGTTVTYCFTVTNTGSVDLLVAEVVDLDLNVTVPLPAAVQQIAPGASVTVAIDAPATAIENTASVTGTPVDPGGDPIPDAPNPEDDDTATVRVPVPSIAVTKTVVLAGDSCDDAFEGIDEYVVTSPGDVITWCIVVTNDGEVPLTDVVINDPVAGVDNVVVVASPQILAIGASETITIDDVVPAEGLVNTVTASAVPSNPDGTPVPGAPPVDDTNTAEADAADIALSKTVVAGAAGDCGAAVDEVTVPDGTIVTYCFTVTNTGSVDLLVAEVVDADLNITIPVPAGQQVLSPGASILLTAEAAATPLTNTASVEGTPVDPGGDPLPGPTPTDTDTAVVQTQVPMLDLVKTVVVGPLGTCPASLAAGVAGPGDALEVNVGDTVTYCINVANTGELDIDNVTVSDPMAPAGTLGNIGTLAQGAETVVSFDLVVTSTTALVNTAQVTGDDPAGGQLPPDTDTAVIERTVPNPAINVIKTVVAGVNGNCASAGETVTGTAGDDVTWCITVQNTGNVPLTSIVVSDDLIGLDAVDVLAVHGGGAASLAVGTSISFSLAGTIPAGGLTNVVAATATPSDPDGTPLPELPTVDDNDDAVVEELRADLSLAKSVSNQGPVAVGELLTYTLVIANAGPDAADDVSVTDVLPTGIRIVELPALDGWTCSENDNGFTCDRDESMPAGGSETLSYTAVTTVAAPRGQALENVATVTSSTVDPTPDNNTDRTSTRIPVPSVAVFPPSPPLQPVVITNPPPSPAPAPTAPPLALTGTESMLLTAIAALLISVGGGMEIASRRRRNDAA